MNAELEVWKVLRDKLRELRGSNQFRGSEQHLLEQKQIRIPFEWRGSKQQNLEYVIHLTPSLETLWAERLPDHARLAVSEFNGDWKRWLEAIVDECVAGPYLHTNSSKADYRHVDGLEETTQKVEV